MRVTSALLLGFSLITSSVLAHPLDNLFDISPEEIVKRQSNVVTTGVTGGSPQPRYEIRQMLNTKPNQWTLFILAMQQWEATGQTAATSYYQIAGIHGVPRVDYNGVGQCSACSGTDGYCTHNMILFPAWHRAYLALFEQQLVSVVNNIANTWPTSGAPTSRAQMQGAAATFRLPYWDWAAHPPTGLNTFPTVISEKMITVNGPKGQETILNPLFRYNFDDPSQLVYSDFTTWDVTLRWPNSNAPTASSQEADVTSTFQNIRASLQEQIFQMFTSCQNYLVFSNDVSGTAACPNSLETIHNTIHQNTGGQGGNGIEGGHMNYLPLAGFDPVFWLHHANVDRYFAMWQTLYPNQYSATQNAPGSTWTIANQTPLDMNSPLTPFMRDSSGDFWTPNLVRNWKTTFNYDYPEFVDSDGSSSAIASYVNKLYGPSATATAGSSKRTAIPEPVAAPEATPTGTVNAPLTAANGSLFQYVANIKTPRFALNGSYAIFLFLGNPATENPNTWAIDSNLVGPLGVLAQDGMANMSDFNIVSTGGIPITRALAQRVQSGDLSDLTEASVTPYLKENLVWRIQGPKGTEVAADTIPNFELGVVASTSTQPEDEGCLPEWSTPILLEEITQGKAGGVNMTSNGNEGGFIGAEPAGDSSSPAMYTVTATLTSSTTICPETVTSAPSLSVTSAYAAATS